MRLMALRRMINRLRNVENYQKLENYLGHKNRKAKKRLSLEIWLS